MAGKVWWHGKTVTEEEAHRLFEREQKMIANQEHEPSCKTLQGVPWECVGSCDCWCHHTKL